MKDIRCEYCDKLNTHALKCPSDGAKLERIESLLEEINDREKHRMERAA